MDMEFCSHIIDVGEIHGGKNEKNLQGMFACSDNVANRPGNMRHEKDVR